jgi:hypothetical protein
MEICNIGCHPDGTADYAVMKKTPPFTGALKAAWKKGVISSDNHAINHVITSEDDEIISTFVGGHHRTKRGVYDLLHRAMTAMGLDER